MSSDSCVEIVIHAPRAHKARTVYCQEMPFKHARQDHDIRVCRAQLSRIMTCSLFAAFFMHRGLYRRLAFRTAVAVVVIEFGRIGT